METLLEQTVGHMIPGELSLSQGSFSWSLHSMYIQRDRRNGWHNPTSRFWVPFGAEKSINFEDTTDRLFLEDCAENSQPDGLLDSGTIELFHVPGVMILDLKRSIAIATGRGSHEALRAPWWTHCTLEQAAEDAALGNNAGSPSTGCFGCQFHQIIKSSPNVADCSCLLCSSLPFREALRVSWDPRTHPQALRIIGNSLATGRRCICETESEPEIVVDAVAPADLLPLSPSLDPYCGLVWQEGYQKQCNRN